MSQPRASRLARVFTTALLLSVSLLLAAAAGAQALPGLPGSKPVATPAPTPEPTPEPVPEAPDSPRASARSFVELAARKGDFEKAARYLSLPAGEEARGPELARRLRAVLERHLDIDLDAVSPLSEGAQQDGLPPGVDTVGSVPDGRGGQDPVFIVRSRDSAGYYWAFSRQTVSRVEGWYDALPDRWVRDWMPERLQRHGPAGLMWWQWLSLPVLLVLALVLGRVLGIFTTALLHRLFRKTSTGWDERLLRRYLSLPAGEEARGPEIARRLRAVLERHLDIDLDAVSPLSEGAQQDGLPPGVDTVGSVPDGRGGQDPVFIVRSRDSAGYYWAFSRQTVSRVEGWYDALPDRWVRDWMPERLQRHGPADLMWWQWLSLPVLLVLPSASGGSSAS